MVAYYFWTTAAFGGAIPPIVVKQKNPPNVGKQPRIVQAKIMPKIER